MSNQSFYQNVDQLLNVIKCQRNPNEYLNERLADLARTNPSVQNIVQILNGNKSGNPEMLFKNIFNEYGLNFNEVISYLSRKGINI